MTSLTYVFSIVSFIALKAAITFFLSSTGKAEDNFKGISHFLKAETLDGSSSKNKTYL